MPKEEAPVPWAISHADGRDLYPRKNVYFVGVGAEELYNYCIWQTHVAGHTTLENKKARGVSAFIVDILMRRYFDRMFDPEQFIAFAEWATANYRSDIALRCPEPRLVAATKMLRSWPNRSQLVGSLEELQLSSNDYQLMSRFCQVFTRIFGPLFEDAEAAEHAS